MRSVALALALTACGYPADPPAPLVPVAHGADVVRDAAAVPDAPVAVRPLQAELHGPFLVDVEINFQRRRMIVDTGVTSTLLKKSSIEHLGIVCESATTVQTPSGPVAAQSCPLRVGVPGFESQFVTALVVDTIVPTEADGLLGFDVLSHMVIEFDPVAGTVRLTSPASYAHPAGATPIALRVEDRAATIDAVLQGARGTSHARLAVDSGLLGTLLLDKDVARQLGGTRVRSWVKGGINSAAQVDGIRLRSIDLGAGAIAKVEALIPAAVRFDGFLGLELLRRYRTTIDLSHGQLWLDPIAAP